MNRYLVEVHAAFNRAVTDEAESLQSRLAEHDDVLSEPAPMVLSDGTEQHTIVQFAIEAANELKADGKGLDIATEVLGGEGEGPAEVGLVSARRLDLDEPV